MPDFLRDQLRKQAVALGLTFAHAQATFETDQKYSLYYGATCLISSTDPGPIEFYMYGYRDGRTLPTDQAGKLLALVDLIINKAGDTGTFALTVKEIIEPLTRERALTDRTVRERGTNGES